MYPLLRSALALMGGRGAPDRSPFEPVVTYTRVWPWDADIFLELNHGRTLTLYELGRWRYTALHGFLKLARRRNIAFGVAGTSVRYRRRIPLFARVKTVTRVLGWDDRFAYFDHTMWLKGECANQGLLRIAMRSPKGVLPPDTLLRDAGFDHAPPELPDWVKAWIEAEATRPWPPEDLSQT